MDYDETFCPVVQQELLRTLRASIPHAVEILRRRCTCTQGFIKQGEEHAFGVQAQEKYLRFETGT